MVVRRSVIDGCSMGICLDGSALRSLTGVDGLRDVGGISLSNAGNMPDWEVDACTYNRLFFFVCQSSGCFRVRSTMRGGSVVLHSSRENSITKIGSGVFEVF